MGPTRTNQARSGWATIEVLYEALTLESQSFWDEKDVSTLAEEQGASAYTLPEAIDEDPWRDDAEATALIAAIRGDD